MGFFAAVLVLCFITIKGFFWLMDKGFFFNSKVLIKGIHKDSLKIHEFF